MEMEIGIERLEGDAVKQTRSRSMDADRFMML